MSELSSRLEEIFSPKRLIDYSKTQPVEPGIAQNLFPNMYIDGYETDYILSQYNRGELGTLSAYDVPATLRQREGFDKGKASLMFFKDKYKLDEKEIMLLRRAVSSPEFGQTIQKIYHDTTNLRQMMENRCEWMRYQAMCTGKLVMDAENPNDVKHPLKVNIDFGVPEDHKNEVDWLNPETDIFEEIFKIDEKILADTGFHVEHIITTREVLYTWLKNPIVRLTILGNDKKAGMITAGQLNAELSSYGLPTISIDEKRYKLRKPDPATGEVKTTFEPYFERDLVLFLPGGTLGNTLRGTTPEAEGISMGANVQNAGECTLTYYEEVEPVAHYIKASMTAGIIFPYANQIFISKVKRD